MIKGAGHLLALINEALDLNAVERGELKWPDPGGSVRRL
jgi:hypothetical protein